MVSILGANSVSGDYEVSNSLRFDDGSGAYVSRTQTAGNRRTFTWSAWVKRGVVGTRQTLLSAGIDGNDESFLRFDASDYISFKESTGNSPEFLLDTTPVFRDPAAWYHIVYAIDTTQGTDSNRVKLYVNGSQITSFQNTNYPSQNYDTRFNNNSQVLYLGMNVPDYRDYYDGYMTEVNYIDGSAKSPTDFGEYDDNGVWVPKKYSGSYGTNGFFLEFQQTGTSQNSSGIGADTSGNDNHLAVTNLAGTDVTTDTCTNNYCTLNSIRGPVGSNSSNVPLFEGNLKASHTDNAYKQCEGTIFPTAGKWYWETLIVSDGTDAGAIGIVTSGQPTGAYPGTTINGYGYDSYGSGSKIHNNSRDNSYGASYTVDDIMGTALDLDNGTLTFYKNNSSQGQAYSGITSSLGWSYGHGSYYATNTIIVNFGQEGSFAGQKTAQGNSDANGYGDFYYSPPSGHYALNTKNLAEFG